MQEPTIVLSVRVRPDQKAMLWQYGKDNGCLSISEAARRLFDDFTNAQLERPAPAKLSQSARVEAPNE